MQVAISLEPKKHAGVDIVRFTLKVLKGLKGELSTEMFLYSGQFEDCPAVEKLIKKSGRDNTSIKTNVIEIQAERNVYNLELTFPFPGCKKKE